MRVTNRHPRSGVERRILRLDQRLEAELRELRAQAFEPNVPSSTPPGVPDDKTRSRIQEARRMSIRLYLPERIRDIHDRKCGAVNSPPIPHLPRDPGQADGQRADCNPD